MNYLRVREFMLTDRVLLRIGEPRLLAGRYWLNVDSLSGGRQLLEKLKQYEAVLHPEEARKYAKRHTVGGKRR